MKFREVATFRSQLIDLENRLLIICYASFTPRFVTETWENAW